MKPKIALVHDWMVNPGGAEKVLYELHKMYPEAPIYTTAYVAERFPEFADADIRVTWMDKYHITKYKHQFFSPLRALTYAFKDLPLYFRSLLNFCFMERNLYIYTSEPARLNRL